MKDGISGTRRRNCRTERGTIISYFLVLTSLVTTGMLMTVSLTAGVETQVASLTLKRDQAYYAAEAGIQNAYWMLQANNNYRTTATPLAGTVGNGSYAVTVTGGWDSPVLISSTGTAGSGATVATVAMTATCSPTVIVPAITLGNNFNNSGNVTINGDVQAKGNIYSNGRFNENGSLYAGGSISTKGSVDISGVSAANTPNITIPTINFNALVASATQTVHVLSGKKTYEVSSVNFGQGGIVYFDGPISFKGNVSVTGYGTLVVNGDVSIQGGASFGSSSSPATANIVTAGGLDIGGYLGLVGSIYAGGTISKNGGFDVTGVIVGQTDMGTSGGMTITRAQPPSFDPRSQPAGQGTMVLSRVTGPIF